MYGKLINNELHVLRLPIKADGEDIFTNDPVVLLRYGYKEVIFTDPPECEEGYYAESAWDETETTIIQRWTVVPIPPEEVTENEYTEN